MSSSPRHLRPLSPTGFPCTDGRHILGLTPTRPFARSPYAAPAPTSARPAPPWRPALVAAPPPPEGGGASGGGARAASAAPPLFASMADVLLAVSALDAHAAANAPAGSALDAAAARRARRNTTAQSAAPQPAPPPTAEGGGRGDASTLLGSPRAPPAESTAVAPLPPNEARASSAARTQMSAPAAAARACSALIESTSRALGLTYVSPLALARCIAAAASTRGRIRAPPLVGAVSSLSVLAAGDASAAALAAVASAWVAHLWPALEAVSGAPLYRAPAVGDVDVRVAASAALVFLTEVAAAEKYAALWFIWADSGRTAHDTMTEGLLARAIGAVVSGAAAAAVVGADRAGVARPRAADAVATGKEIAHAAFRDTRPGGAPASINASLFTQWAALRGVDLFAV
jgi:hypothetical protein